MYRNIKVTTQGKGNHYKMKKQKTGQEAFIINESNNEITPVIVDKAGRIYLTVGRQRFSLEHGLGRLPWSHDYGVANYLAPDKETSLMTKWHL